MSSKPSSRRSKRKPLILVAEDDPADQELIRRALGGNGYALEIVADGVELLDYLAEDEQNPGSRPADLVLLDLNMPRIDGIQALKELRDRSTASRVPIVIFSSSGRRKDVQECYKAGCAAYVVKPTDLEPFNETLQIIAKFWLDLVKRPAANI